MKYLIGAVFGAVLAVLPGIPAFTTWTTAVDKPFLFDLYCYEAETRGDRSACPGGRTALVAGVGALAGVAGAAARRRFERQDSAAPQDQADTTVIRRTRVLQSPNESIEAKNFFVGLFDMRFKTFITPKLARLMYILLLVVVVMQFIYVVRWFNENTDVGLGILVGIASSFILIVFSRVAVEGVTAFFSAVSDLRTLAADIDDDIDDYDAESDR